MTFGKTVKSIVAACVVMACTGTFTAAFAQSADKSKKVEGEEHAALANMSPHQVVESVTEQLMSLVQKGKTAIDTNPEQYYTDVQLVMEKVVDFNYIAKNVMGAKHWNSATVDQKKRFVEVFTSGLVQTYAKGMANFADFEISVVPPEDDIGERKRVAVIQKFKGPEGINRVAYTMGKHKSGEWRLINVVLDGVNLGETLRSQFAQSVAENKGDLDATINGWQLKS